MANIGAADCTDWSAVADEQVDIDVDAGAVCVTADRVYLGRTGERYLSVAAPRAFAGTSELILSAEGAPVLAAYCQVDHELRPVWRQTFVACGDAEPDAQVVTLRWREGRQTSYPIAGQVRQ